MELKKLKNILEAVLLAAERSMTAPQLEALFELDEERPTRDEIRKALHEMEEEYETRSLELKHVASGYRLQVKQEYATWVGRLWEERPARYTRALLETMALIAYRQPITRGEIEEVRGVSVSSNIIKTLLERDWIKVLGHKDVPGKPTLYGTTKEFLDYFNLQKLDELPTLAEIKDLDAIHPELELDEDVTEKTDDDISGDAAVESSDDISNDISNDVSNDVSNETPKDLSANDALAEAAVDSQQADLTEDEMVEGDTVKMSEEISEAAESEPAMAEADDATDEDDDAESGRPAFNV